MNKKLIQSRFEKCLKTYDENAIVQKIMAKNIAEMLDNFHCNNILEIGCGTGLLTKEIVKKIEYKTFKALDIVTSCESFIKQIDEQIIFLPADIESFILQNDIKYDLIISNASLQWVNNLEEVINNLVLKLTENGTFVFTLFGKNNYKEISSTLNKSLNYYSKEDLETILKQYNYQISEETHQIEFSTPIEILKHMKYTGVNSLEEISWTKKDMFKFEQECYKICKGSPKLTYNPIYIKIINQ